MTLRKLFVIAALLAISAPALAQRDALEIMRADYRAEKTAVLTEALELTESESAAFWPVYREYEVEYAKINDRRLELVQNYAANCDAMTDADANKLIQDSFTLQQERIKLMKKYYAKVEKAVSTKLAARWIQTEMAIDAIVTAQVSAELPLLK